MLRKPMPRAIRSFDNAEHVLRIAPKSVELPDDENVTFAEVVEAGVETRSSRYRAGYTLVAEHSIDSRVAQRI